MRWIPSGTFLKGSEDFYPEERVRADYSVLTVGLFAALRRTLGE
jgi:hypothetical protein